MRLPKDSHRKNKDDIVRERDNGSGEFYGMRVKPVALLQAVRVKGAIRLHCRLLSNHKPRGLPFS